MREILLEILEIRPDLSPEEICCRLDCSVASYYRWLANESQPRRCYLRRAREFRDNLIYKKNKW